MMEELVTDIDNRFQIPRKYRNAKTLTVRMPYQVRVIRGRSIQMWFRHKGEKDSRGREIKPYVPEGFVEINKERFKVIEPDWSMLIGCINEKCM